MKVAVSTPTGNIGRVVTERLLDAGTELILIARDPDKVKELARRGATVLQGSLADEELVKEATRGVDTFFFVTPSDFQAKSYREFQNGIGKVAAAAVKANEVPRVVNISSVGAHLESGTGPILGLRDNEKHLDATGASVTHLRPNMFMENFLSSVETIRGMKCILLPVPGGAGARLIATRDIGEFAARRIRDVSWSGRHVIELSGPEHVTFDDAARILSEELGEPIAHVPVGADQAEAGLSGAGFSPDSARTMVELYTRIGEGSVDPEQPFTAENTTRTTFAGFVREVLAPAVRASSSVS